MKGMVSQAVRQRIKELPPGTLFGLKEFLDLENVQAVMLELSRLAKKKEITRLGKGKYYVPRKSRFGTLMPDEWRILDQVIKENGGYFAGLTALNRIGVTTQIPSEVTIRGAKSTRRLKVGNVNVNFLRQGNSKAVSSDATLTDILEALRLIKRTPDGDIEKSIKTVAAVLRARSMQELNKLVVLAEAERPYVRALLGALMETAQIKGTEKLKQSLNPATKFRLGIPQKLLPNKANWGIA